MKTNVIIHFVRLWNFGLRLEISETLVRSVLFHCKNDGTNDVAFDKSRRRIPFCVHSMIVSSKALNSNEQWSLTMMSNCPLFKESVQPCPRSAKPSDEKMTTLYCLKSKPNVNSWSATNWTKIQKRSYSFTINNIIYFFGDTFAFVPPSYHLSSYWLYWFIEIIAHSFVKFPDMSSSFSSVHPSIP